MELTRGHAGAARARLARAHFMAPSAPAQERSFLGALALAGILLLLAGSLAAWALSLPHIDVTRVTDMGLVSVLPASVFAATGLLSLSFALTLRRRSPETWLVLLHLAALIVMLYAIAPLVEHEVPRFTAAYKHIGVTGYIISHGSVDPSIDAYFNWPGFFIFAALVSKVTGVSHPEQVIQWAPVAFNLLYLAPLAGILGSATGDRRFMWLGVWFFYMMNWIGQDYFSPQGLSYFLYLVMLAIVLIWFRAPSRWPTPLHRFLGLRLRRSGVLGAVGRWIAGWVAPPDAPSAYTTGLQRLGLILALIAIFAAMVASHQLTPFATVAALAGLSIFNRSSLRGLPLILCAVLVTWIIFLAGVYLEGHISSLTGNMGRVGSTLNQNVGSRLQGSKGHLLVVHYTLLTAATIVGLAGLGALRSIIHGYRDLTYVILLAAPVCLLGLQSYDGEGALRVYLYALPAIIFFVSALFFTTPSLGRSWLVTAVIALASMCFIGAFYLARYGNERMDYVSPAELTAVQHMYDIAPAGSILLAGSDNLAWKFRGYDAYTYAALDDTQYPSAKPLTHGRVSKALGIVYGEMTSPKYPASYLIFTRTEAAYVEMFGIYPRGTFGRLEASVRGSPSFKLVYSNPDAQIYTVRRPHASGVAASSHRLGPSGRLG